MISRARRPFGPRFTSWRLSRIRIPCLVLIGCGLLAACTRYPEPVPFLAARGIEVPSETSLTICHGYDCTFHTTVSLTPDEWKSIAAPLEKTAPDAASERTQIALAIAQFELVVGAKTGTGGDLGKLRFLTAGDETQMDCIDETTNTTTYLVLLESRGKLHWHRTGRPAKRGAFIDGRWYHETAVIVEAASGAEFAIDSWFEDNGMPPHIIPLDDWSLSWNYS